MGAIEPMYVQKWQLKLSKKLNPSYVRAGQGLFSMAMDRAVVLGLANEDHLKWELHYPKILKHPMKCHGY